MYFNLLGRFDEARRELELALALDPLSLQISQSMALASFLSGKYDLANEELQKTIEMNPNYHPSLYLLGRTYEQTAQLNEAIVVFKKIVELDDAPMFLAGLGHAYALAGKHRDARRILDTLDQQSKHRYVSAYHKAIIHVALGEKDRAFSYLEEACEKRCEMMTWLKVDPAFNNIRTDLRFTDLERRVGLHSDF